ncbi:hypothetical protein HAX54_028882 [Datura stramonium]|uniref:Uncharacterized protein n=1 Tax=Datura stramonium TaxID=4076 RepID=A0ABS8V649_DATST|nr:hypothetical protein [Datura stramonium]
MNDIKETIGEDRSSLQTNKSANQIFDEKFKYIDNSSIKSCTIFKVNVALRESNPNAYIPKMISIGPYHKKNSQLVPMEKYKLLYLQRFLRRKEELDVESCISQLEELKEKAIKCYEDIEDITDDQFLQMLLLDGCFVVEFIRDCHGIRSIGEDRIINTGCMDNQVCRDLLLVENQLPFFILTKLHDMTKEVNETPFIKLVMTTFFSYLPKMTPASYGESKGNVKADIKHLLQVVHMSCHPSAMKYSLTSRKPRMQGEYLRRSVRYDDSPSKGKEDITRHKVMPNATELFQAGVSFIKVGYIYIGLDEDNIDDTTSLFDIKFENGLMEIPCFQVTYSTEIVMRNLIAYEQHSSDVDPTYFSDYIVFMDYLIDSDKDVSLLRRKGIIRNRTGEDNQVANIFNKMGKGVTIYTNFYYREECKKAVKHCEKPWNLMKASLRHNYFSSPWAGVSTVAAIVLLITSIDNQIPLLLRTEKDEIEEGSNLDHLIEIQETNGQDRSELQKNKSVKQIFDEKFMNLKNSSNNSTTIFRVTEGLRKSNPDAYKPMLISIGPYHNKNLKLRSMGKYKLMYLQRFLRRKGGIDVESCISELEKLKDEALKCYEDIQDLGNNFLANFTEILLLDGCFVVEYILENYGMLPKGEKVIIKRDCIRNQVNRDLLLLENQLPFFVLTKLHDMTKEVEVSFTKYLKYFFLDILLKRMPASLYDSKDNEKNIKHLLHALHMAYQPSEMKTRNPNMGAENFSKCLCCWNPLQIIRTKYIPKDDEDNISWTRVMPNATELFEAGVSFAKVKNLGDSKNVFDIKFDKGVMSIPYFEVEDDTETLLRNIIAYEQQSSDVYLSYFTDFTTFMDYLIDSDKDVSLLRRNGIIENGIGEDNKVASLFNKIGYGVSISSDFYYEEECKKAFKHCKKPWNKMKASLRHNYFSSPWVGASTVAAIILLLLTATQTILAFIGVVN